ncbi:MAG: hypothetical protein QXD13_00445 [Candidatus Pacearchaeota archaeon]
MLPRWHILTGLIFSLLIWIIFPSVGFYVFLVLFGAVFIDFDHYMCAVWKTGKISLHDAFIYHKKLLQTERKEYARKIFKKGDFHIFHTIEFHLLVLLLSYLWIGLFYIFIGMLFHSILDFIELAAERKLYRREFLLLSWIAKKN